MDIKTFDHLRWDQLTPEQQKTRIAARQYLVTAARKISRDIDIRIAKENPDKLDLLNS